ncbi:hypothetical protein DPMN_128849 [Dreissena polymorpha]|uniref:Uncharacterized protein n=1 Tax=Dreissena polymorpha TaxID=45954 RepID=A0A9D4H7X9_DREPO|nr:hypothetical protein DPMN_128849 [Dreissena polymorpha]
MDLYSQQPLGFAIFGGEEYTDTDTDMAAVNLSIMERSIDAEVIFFVQVMPGNIPVGHKITR